MDSNSAKGICEGLPSFFQTDQVSKWSAGLSLMKNARVFEKKKKKKKESIIYLR